MRKLLVCALLVLCLTVIACFGRPSEDGPSEDVALDGPAQAALDSAAALDQAAQPVVAERSKRAESERNPDDGNRPAWGEFRASFTENVHGGNGWAWVATIGASPRDYPGTAAVISNKRDSLSPAGTTLVSGGLPQLLSWSGIGQFCQAARALHESGAAVAARVPAAELELQQHVPAGRSDDGAWSSSCPGCPGAPSAEDLARREEDSSLERYATAGSSLLLLDPPTGGSSSWPPLQLRSKLLRTVFRPPHPDWSILRLGREAARRLGHELHLAAALPAAIGRNNLWPVAGMLDLVRPMPRQGEHFDPWRTLAINRTLRARGKRPLFQLDGRQSLSKQRQMQRLALYLISGATFMAEAKDKVPASLKVALAWAQNHPEFFFLRAGRVGLYYSLASMTHAKPGGVDDPFGDGVAALDFFGLARLLDELHIPYKVIFAGDGVSVDNAFEPERLGLYDVVLVPRSKRLSDIEHQALLDMSRVGAVVLSGPLGGQDLQGRGVQRTPLVAAEERRIFELTQTGTEYLADPSVGRRDALASQLEVALSVRSTTLGARIETGLPSSVLIERVVDPASSTLVHHFINLGLDPYSSGEIAPTQPTWVRIPAWPRPADLNYEVRLSSPDAPEGVELSYGWLGDSAELEVQLPAMPVWSVLSVRPRLAEVDEHHPPITIDAPALDLTSDDRETRQVSFSVPAWYSGSRKLTLRAPEDVISGSGIAGLGENLRAVWTRAEDGSKASFSARNEHISLLVELVVKDDFIDVSTRIQNIGAEPIERVEAMFCLDPGDIHLFPDSGLDRNYLMRDGETLSLGSERHGSGTPNFSEGKAFDVPMTVLESVDDRWALGHAFEQSEILGANGSGGGVCIHTRPRFGDLAVGVGATRRGRLYLARGSAEELFARLQREEPFTMSRPSVRGPKLQHPCLPAIGAQ